MTHTIAIKWKVLYVAVVVDCHHNLHLCGDRVEKVYIFIKMSYITVVTSTCP